MKLPAAETTKKLYLLVIILVGESLLTGLIPHSKGHLFELLEIKSVEVWAALFIFGANLFILDCFQSFKAWVIMKTALLFRKEETEKMRNLRLKEVSSMPQRIQEDIKLNFLARYTVYAEYFISGTIVLQLMLLNLHYPLLICTALIYSAISVWAAIHFNPKLTYAEKYTQEAEAQFRTSLTANIRDITLLGDANNANLKAAKIRLHYTLFTRLQLWILAVAPFIVLFPGYLAGDFGLGEVMKHQSTFSLIVVNAAILIQCYPTLIQGRASKARVDEMKND